MKNLLIVSFFLVQSCMAFAQNCCINDSAIREFQFPLTEKETNTVFYYFNDEWIAIPIDIVSTDSIQKMEVKDDKYGNRAIFFTISPEYLDQIKAETRKFLINLDPVCEFPGGNGKFKEWLDTNIQTPLFPNTELQD